MPPSLWPFDQNRRALVDGHVDERLESVRRVSRQRSSLPNCVFSARRLISQHGIREGRGREREARPAALPELRIRLPSVPELPFTARTPTTLVHGTGSEQLDLCVRPGPVWSLVLDAIFGRWEPRNWRVRVMTPHALLRALLSPDEMHGGLQDRHHPRRGWFESYADATDVVGGTPIEAHPHIHMLFTRPGAC